MQYPPMKSLFLLILGTVPALVEPHAHLESPASRSHEAWVAGLEDCPWCKHGGGKGTCQENQFINYGDGFYRWPPSDDVYEDSRHAICGNSAGPVEGNDASVNLSYDDFGVIDPNGAKVFEKGSVIDVTIYIKAHHEGHVELRLCDASNNGCDLSYQCLNQYVLLPVGRAGPDGVSQFDFPVSNDYVEVDDYTNTCGVNTADPLPYDECFPERVFLGNKRNTPKVGAVWKLSYQVQLPPDVTCTHCVIHFTYMTSNACLPAGYRDETKPFSDHSNLQDCGAGGTYLEEFWGCSDVAIVEDLNAIPEDVGNCSDGTDLYAALGGGGGGEPPCCSDCSCGTRSECNSCTDCQYSNKNKICNSI